MATINDPTERTIFTPEQSPEQFFSQSRIIAFGSARETVRNLGTFLLLDALNAWLKRTGEAARDEAGNRALRLILAIDEAPPVLATQHQALSDNIRLHRSKGLMVMLASQSPDDYAYLPHPWSRASRDIRASIPGSDGVRGLTGTIP